MITEVFYIGHDNTIDLLLKADGEAVDLSDITRIKLIIGSTEIDSNSESDVFTWTDTGTTGKVIVDLNEYSGTLAAGAYTARLIVYDIVHTDGIVWGEFYLYVKE